MEKLIFRSKRRTDRIFRLTNVALVERFHVNIVSHRKLRIAGYRWDDLGLRVLKDQQEIFKMKQLYGQFM
ncbi:hypothetical protein V1525DRAFT_412498 [Lipomyces kononenkoae]|uniref:Uncharacterized protein n=1 Tax=Lipomyces kononenkoae TaxID=34357 RepID=A0ACC3STI3_LIPKO